MTDFERIEEVKKKVGKSYNAISAEICVNRNTFSDIKNGKCHISEKLARKMQEKYGFNEVWLLTGEGEMFVQPPTANNTINNSGDFCENVIGGDLKQQLAELINIQKKFQDMISVKDKQINELIEILKDKKK